MLLLYGWLLLCSLILLLVFSLFYIKKSIAVNHLQYRLLHLIVITVGIVDICRMLVVCFGFFSAIGLANV